MYLVNRIYADRVGHQDAFYRDVLIDFVNHFTNQPDSSVVQLSNAGGKTTLLSMFYSCFEPNKNEWIQHRQTSNFKFRDYFTHELALIAIELVTESGPLVIGQYVQLRQDNDEHRFFFSFQPVAGLSLDSLPSMSRKTASSYLDVQKWLHDCTTDYPGNFYTTSNQNKWKEHLKSKGFDLWLIYKQMQFCHAEGGILSFADFKSEEQFLAAFYAMVINPDQTQEIARTLSNAMRDHRELPRKKRQSQWVEKACDWWQPLYQSAKAFFEFNEQHRTALTETIAYDNGLVVLYDSLTEQSNKMVDRQNTLEEQKRIVEHRKQDAEQIAEATQSAWLAARVEKHICAEQRFSNQIDQLELTKRVLETSLYYQEQAGAEANHKEANKWLKELEKESAPLLQAVNVAEAKMHFKYQFEANLAKEKLTQVQSRIRILEQRRKAEDLALKDVGNQITCNELELKRIRQDKQRLDKELDQRRTTGQLLSNESIDEAITRHEAELKKLVDSLTKQETELDELRHEEIQLKGLLRTIEVGLIQLQRQKGEVEQWLALYLQEQGLLCNKAALKLLVHGEEIKLTAALLDRGRKSWSEKRLRSKKLERALDQLCNDIECLEKHGSMLVDDNVQVALNYLSDNGVSDSDVMAFPTYLMELYGENEAKIKQIIESDPSRYLGIAIVNPTVVERVKTLASEIDVLPRPVMASVYNTELGSHDGVILPPADPACYSESLLVKKLEGLKEEHCEITEALETAESELSALEAVLPKLERFLQDYPADVIECKELQLERLQVDVEQESRRLSEAEEKYALNADAIIEKDKLLGQGRQAQQHQDRMVHDIQAFFEHKWQPVQVQVKKEPELDAQLVQLQSEVAERTGKLVALDEELEREQDVADNHRAYAIQYSDRANEYPHHDILFNDTERAEFLALDASALREQESKCRNTYMAQTQSERAERARREVESSHKVWEEARTAFSVAFEASKLEQAFIPQIMEQASRHKREILTEQKQNLIVLDDLAGKRNASMGQRKLVEKELQDFDAHRKYPKANTLAPCIADKTDPSQLRAAYREYKRKTEQDQEVLNSIELQLKDLLLGMNNLTTQQMTLKLARSTLAKMIKEEPDLANEVKTKANIELETCEEQAIQYLDWCTDLERQKRQKYTQAERALTNIRKRLDNPEAQESISGVCVTFKQFELLYANRSLEHINAQLNDQLSALKFQLAEDEAQFEQRLSHVVDHVDTALYRLNQAVSFSRIPGNHPLAGNKSVLKNRFNNDLTDSERRTKIKLYVESLMKNEDGAQALPATDTKSDLLTARLAMSVAKINPVDAKEKDPFGLEFIKIGNTVSYLPIALSGGSGAQKLIQSMLLYLSLACMRQREKRTKGLYSGFLFLDNPFAQMNHAQMVSSGVMLAKSLGYQLCFFTGHRDANAFDCFNKIISMCNTSKFDQTNGRYLVEVEQDIVREPTTTQTINTIVPTHLDVNEIDESEVDGAI